MAKEKFKAATPPCKRSAVKRKHNQYSRREKTSRAAQADLFTSEMEHSGMKRLHKQGVTVIQ
jgi:hypothetical protein